MPNQRITKKTRKLIKVGNSLSVSLPSFMLRRFGLKEGDPVRVDVAENGMFLIEPIKKGES